MTRKRYLKKLYLEGGNGNELEVFSEYGMAYLRICDGRWSCRVNLQSDDLDRLIEQLQLEQKRIKRFDKETRQLEEGWS